jgi:hypothetical protein
MRQGLYHAISSRIGLSRYYSKKLVVDNLWITSLTNYSHPGACFVEVLEVFFAKIVYQGAVLLNIKNVLFATSPL